MKTTSIYIKSLVLQNFRTYGDEVVLRLDKEDGEIPQWTLILGDNGIGKSTLLQGIAWMQPLIPYPDDEQGDDKVEDPQPRITDEENETLVRMVRKIDATTTEESATIKAVFIANKKLNQSQSSKNKRTFETSTTIKLVKGKLRNVLSGVSEGNDDLFLKQEILIYGYSASRQLGKLNLGDPLLEDTIPSFIAENTILYDTEEILTQLDYAALSSRGEEKKKHNKLIKQMKEMLVSVLPDVKNISNIDILAPTLLGKEMRRPGGVLITTKHGKKIPLSDMSLGYRNVISWTIDLAWRMSRQYPDSPNPLAEAAIVLIDEIDLHLHPVWQRGIMDNLSRHFKNTQFIATAHSPLMVQEAIESNYAVLKSGDNGVEIINEPKGIDGWRVDQVLTSEMFGLESARGTKYEKLLSKREKLANKKSLSPKEKAKLKDINEEMSKLPSGENPEEIENRKLISEVASKIRNNNEKIKL